MVSHLFTFGHLKTLCVICVTQSRELSEGMYCSKWWKLPRKYRTAVLIIMQRSERPVVLRASKFCSMSLDNFVMVSLFLL